jgi:hypothetical protein
MNTGILRVNASLGVVREMYFILDLIFTGFGFLRFEEEETVGFVLGVGVFVGERGFVEGWILQVFL